MKTFVQLMPRKLLKLNDMVRDSGERKLRLQNNNMGRDSSKEKGSLSLSLIFWSSKRPRINISLRLSFLIKKNKLFLQYQGPLVISCSS